MTEQEIMGQKIMEARKSHPEMTASQCHDRLMVMDAVNIEMTRYNGDSCINGTQPNPSWGNGSGSH